MERASVDELSKFLSLTNSRIYQLTREGILPKRGEDSKVDLLEALKKYITFLQSVCRNSSGETSAPVKDKARYERARADMAEIDVAIKKNDLIFRSEIETEIGFMVSNFRARILAIPSVVAAQGLGITDHDDLKNLVKKRIYEALEELSRYDPEQKKSQKNNKKRSGDNDPAA